MNQTIVQIEHNSSDNIINSIRMFTPNFVVDKLVSDRHFMACLLAFVASMGTVIGSIIVVIVGKFVCTKGEINRKTKNIIGIFQAVSAGVMLYMTFFDLIPEAIKVIGKFQTLSWFFVGILIFSLIERNIPQDITPNSSFDSKRCSIEGDDDDDKEKKRRMIRASFVTYLGMALHNLPEGFSVYLSTLSNYKLGIQLAMGIMMHNIPEGIIIAIPYYLLSNSSCYVVYITLLNGLIEPLGVILGGLLLKSFLTDHLVSQCLAIVSGIMTFISLHELHSTAIMSCDRTVASRALFVGMFICFLGLESIDYLFHQ